MTKPPLLEMLAGVKVVVVGASAGGVEALRRVLPRATIAPAVAVVLHIPAEEQSLLPYLFTAVGAPPASEPEDKEPLQPGHLYFAPAGYHLLLEQGGTFSLSLDEPAHFSRPAIDVLFESAADAYPGAVLGVVLTGANEDGARGLRAILDAGGAAIVQASETAAAPEMPRAALRLCPEALSLTLPEIGRLLASLRA